MPSPMAATRSSSWLPWLAIAALGWQCLNPLPLSDASWEVDRRSLTWALAFCCALAPATLMAGWRALPRLLRWWLPAWLLAEVVCAVFALQPWPAWIGTPERGLGLLDLGAWCLIVVAMSGVLVRFEFANRLHLGVLACSTLLALWLWAEWLTTSGSVHGQRPGGPLGNPLFAAGVLAPAAVLALGSALGNTTQSSRQRALRWLLTLWLLSALLLSGSRAAIMAVALAGSGLWLSGLTPAARARNVLPVMLLLGLLAVAMFAVRPGSVQIRGHLWVAAVDAAWQSEALSRWDGGQDPLASQRAWIGLGRDNLEPALTRQRASELDTLEMRGHDRLADRSHNAFLDRALEGGLLAGGLSIAVWLALLVGVLGGLRSGRLPPALAAAWLAAWMERSTGVPNAAADLLLALLTAGCIASLHNGSGSKSPVAAKAPDTGVGDIAEQAYIHGNRSGPIAAGIALIPGAVAIALLPLLAVLVSGAHRWLWTSPQSPALGGTAASLGCPDGALTAAQMIALDRQPHSVLPLLRLGEHPLRECRWPASTIAHLTVGAPTLPRAWLQQARLLFAQEQDEAAQAALLRALELVRDDDVPRRMAAYAQAATIQPGAADAARRAADARDALWALGPLPDDRAWWRTMGYLHALAGDRQQAISAYRMALKTDPNDAASRRNLDRLEEGQP